MFCILIATPPPDATSAAAVEDAAASSSRCSWSCCWSSRSRPRPAPRPRRAQAGCLVSCSSRRLLASILPRPTLREHAARWSESGPRSSVRRRPTARSDRAKTWSTLWPATCVEARRRAGARVLRSPPSTTGAPADQRGRACCAASRRRPAPAPRSAPGRAGCTTHQPRSQAHAVHHAPLGPARAACATRCSRDRLAAHEDRVGAAAPGLDRRRAGARAAQREQRQQPVARGQRGARARPRTRGRARRPPRRHLLQQRDVPLPSGEPRGEVGRAARAARRAPSGRGRGSRSGPSIAVTYPPAPCRATSSPAPS